MEWGTAGLIADWLGDLPDGGNCLLGGLVVQNQDSIELFGFNGNLLANLPQGASRHPSEWPPLAASIRRRLCPGSRAV